ncbi:MAG: ribonuclease Z [Thermoplasmata archaeon]|nr:ribonuclease Z [Thermoplasmata archaeon]
MKIVFLGTSGGFPSKDRNVSSVAIKLNSEVLLFDCGEGTQRQLMFSSLSYMKVNRIFITHYHGDHFLGVAGLIQSMCLNHRTAPLHIYGPEGTIHFMNSFLKLGYFNQKMPVFHHELEGGEKIDLERYSLRTLQADHDIPTLAYSIEEPEKIGRFDLKKARALGLKEGPDFRRLQSGQSIRGKGRLITPEMVLGPPRKGRKVVYTGDTRPIQELVEFARDADVLIHEATFHSDLTEKSQKFGHSTAKQAAEIAKRAGVKKLFLTHISNRYSKDATPLLNEAKEVFPNTELARDFMEHYVRLRS